MYVCIYNAAPVSVNIRPQAPVVTMLTSASMPESVGRPPRPWVKITSSTVNGLRYDNLVLAFIAAYLHVLFAVLSNAICKRRIVFGVCAVIVKIAIKRLRKIFIKINSAVTRLCTSIFGLPSQ